MAFAVVMASFSFKIEAHFCGSYLVDISVGSGLESCCAVGDTKDDNLQFTKPSCCSNISIVVEGFNNYQKALSSAFPSTFVFAAVPSLNIPLDYIFETATKVSYSNYNPPPLIANIQMRDQVFLI